jgi:hypothetical protein
MSYLLDIMWIRMSPAEVTWAKWARVLRSLFLYALAGWGLWYLLVRLFMVFGVLPRQSVSGWVGCGVIALMLPAAWYESQRARRKGLGTLVCDRCNLVKLADNRTTCKCGGQYFPLSEMKWTNSARAAQLPAEKEALSHEAGRAALHSA